MGVAAAEARDQVVVFVDYQNVHGRACSIFHDSPPSGSIGHVDPLRLAQHLVQRRQRSSELAQVRVYRGRPNPDYQPRAAAANDRQAAAWETSPLVKVVRRSLQYRGDWPETDPAAERFVSEKGIDVKLAVDLVRLAMQRRYNAVILVSADTDLLPALETVVTLRLGHVEVATWKGGSRLRFGGTQLPWCHTMSESQYRAVQDITNYAAPPG